MSTAKTSTNEQKHAKANAPKTTPNNGKSSDEQLVNDLSKLDQIRDMLFGEQVAALREQCQSLDKSLEKNISTLRNEMKSSANELKQQIEQNFDQLQKRINSEEMDRATQNEQLNSALATINSDIVTKIELETKRIDDALNEQHQDSVRQLNNVADSLQNSKVDRKTLAKFFSQFADELGGSQAK